MTDREAQLDALLARVAAGQLDQLAPDEVERLEAWLNAAPQSAARLADVRPPVEALAEIVPPSAAEWESVFARVEGARRDSRTSNEAVRERRRPRVLRVWEPLLAAAAVLLLALVWRFAPANPAGGGEWELRLATDVQVEEVEVFGDATSFVSVSEGGPTVIWVLDASGQAEQGV